MRFMDITVAKQGTDVEAVEALLLELFQRFERAELNVTEKPLHARVGSTHTAYRYRVHFTHSPIIGWEQDLVPRLQVRTNSLIRVTDPQPAYLYA